MKGLRSIVPLPKESMRDVVARAPGAPPRIEWVKPSDLFVEETYQRSMEGANSRKLVRNVIGGFRWSHFKPPICVRVPDFDALVVIDGQHTATAAASNPHVGEIPVLVVDASDVADRAAAFVGHNRTRLGLTQIAIYKAELAAGDVVAEAVDRACRAAGARVVGSVGETRALDLKPGVTLAVGTLRQLAKHRGEEIVRRALWILTRAGRAPITAAEIAAAALAIEDTDPSLDARFVPVVAKHSANRWLASASSLTADTEIAIPVALATLWRAEIGLSRPPRQVKAGGNAAARAVIRPRSVKPDPEPTPKPAPAPPEAVKPAAPVNARTVSNSGIVVDLDTGMISRDRKTVRIPLDQAMFAGALLRLMPALLPADRIAPKVWGGPVASPKARLKALAEEANFGLAAVRLKIREHQGCFAISDL